MKPIDPKIHGILDYVTVVIFGLAPLLFGLTGFAAVLSYLLAVVHLAMTLLTDFELGYLDTVKPEYHNYVELIVGAVLIFVSFFFASANLSSAGVFYSIMGVIILFVAIFSDYVESESDEGEEPGETEPEEPEPEEQVEAPAEDETEEEAEPDLEDETDEETDTTVEEETQ